MSALRYGLFGCAMLSFAVAGCTSLQRNYSDVIPTDSPATGVPTLQPGTSPTPGSPSACATANPSATLVAMVAFITATPDPKYGVINGYAIAVDGSAPVVAQPIAISANSNVQFVNGEQSGTPSIIHSAIGFPNVSSFPPAPYAFSAALAQPVGTQIGNAPWSTGRLDPGCYSTTFTVPAGTYYFGDYDYYNLTNTRDVIVAS